MMLGDLYKYMQKVKLDHQLTPYTRKSAKWIKDLLNISRDTIKVLEENTDRKISDIPCSNIFADISSRAREIKERINKRDYLKLKCFCKAKGNIIKTERTIWENIFANDKGLISKTYKELIRLNARKTNNLIKNWVKDLNSHFSKEVIQRVQRYMEGFSASLAIREMQI